MNNIKEFKYAIIILLTVILVLAVIGTLLELIVTRLFCSTDKYEEFDFYEELKSNTLFLVIIWLISTIISL